MFFKNSIKNLTRQFGRTLLFFLLLVLVTMFFVLSVGMRTSSTKLLQEADKNFTTTAQLVYEGTNYPDDIAFDKNLDSLIDNLDYDELSSFEHAVSFEPYTKVRGYLGDYNEYDGNPYKDVSVILFRCIGKNRDGSYECRLSKNYYGFDPEVEGLSFSLNLEQFDMTVYGWRGDEPVSSPIKSPLKKDHYYVAMGSFVGDASSLVFTPVRFETSQVMYTPKAFDILTGGESAKFYYMTLQTFNEELYGSHDVYMYGEYMYYDLLFTQLLRISDGPFVDVTDDISEFTGCLYDEEWLETQPKIWQQFLDGKIPEKFDWRNMLYAVMKSYEVICNSVEVIITDAPNLQPNFHQEQNAIKKGRLYTKADGENVCVISDTMANMLGLSVGDEIEISLHNAADNDNYYNSYFYGSGFKHVAKYKIVGTYVRSANVPSVVYIPVQSDAIAPATESEDTQTLPNTMLSDRYLPTGTNNYIIGTFVIENEHVEEFAAYAKSHLSKRCSITIYDEGYLNVAAPLKSMNETSTLLIVICAVTGLTIVILYGYVFVAKQKQTATTMLNLGTGNRRTTRYLLYGSALLALLACTFGVVAGIFASEFVLSFAYDWAESNSIIDYSYSIIKAKETVSYTPDFSADVSVFAVTGAIIFLLCVFVCSRFARKVIISKNIDAEKTPIAKIRKLSRSFKYSWISVLRTPGRSITVVAVSLAIVILISVFCGVLASYTQKIEDMYDTIPISGRFTSLSGNTADKLLLEGAQLDTLVKSGYITNLNYTYSMKYEILGIHKFEEDRKPEDLKYDDFDGYDLELDMPSNPYEQETFEAELFNRSSITFTTSLDASPEISNEDVNETEYFNGYDNTCFESLDSVCAIPFDLAKSMNIQLGDDIYISVSNNISLSNLILKVVAFVPSDDMRVYAPIGILSRCSNYVYTLPEMIPEESLIVNNETFDDNETQHSDENRINKYEVIAYSKLSSFSFDVADSHALDEFKNYLKDEGYSYPSHIRQIRKAIVLDDSELKSAVNNLVKIKGYMEVLYPAIYVVIIAISIVTSFLLVRSKKPELAIMRSLGAGRGKTLFILFIEQLTLIIIGAVIGVIGIFAIIGSITLMQVYSIILYIACYAVGIIIAVLAINGVNVLQILSSKD